MLRLQLIQVGEKGSIGTNIRWGLDKAMFAAVVVVEDDDIINR